MTNVLFKKKQGKIVSFNINGHSGFDEYNRDIVCSGISVLSQTTLIGILEVLKIDVDYSIKDGFLSLSIEQNSCSEIHKCQVLLKTMLLGLKSMELSYGDYISVNVEEV
ncbi:ribosomal-processing cysteine protease Prp [Haloimpatiens sp. FM7330]|jgi:uncharacterized protein|uniref:ribosomal-processing cysteine protease Prp n=1 Tax=Haloimpatiens sp. FM7330 TaxID=3298610 RepID=UPI0036386469